MECCNIDDGALFPCMDLCLIENSNIYMRCECYDSKCPTLVKYGLEHVFISS